MFQHAFAIFLIGAIVLVVSQSDAKVLAPAKFHNGLAEQMPFLYTFDYNECRPLGDELTSTFKDYTDTPLLFGDLEVTHGVSTSCATDIQLDFSSTNLKLSNGLRLAGGQLDSDEKRNAVTSASFDQASLLQSICGGTAACTFGKFGLVLEMWISITDYETAFTDDQTTTLFELDDRVKLFVNGTTDELIFEINLENSNTPRRVIGDVSENLFEKGLNVVTVVVEYQLGTGLFAHLYVNFEKLDLLLLKTPEDADMTLNWSGTTRMRLGASKSNTVEYMFNGVVHLVGLHYPPSVPSKFGTNFDSIRNSFLIRGIPNNPAVLVSPFLQLNEGEWNTTIEFGTLSSMDLSLIDSTTMLVYDFDTDADMHSVFRYNFPPQPFTLSASFTDSDKYFTSSSDGKRISTKLPNKFSMDDNDECNTKTTISIMHVVVSELDQDGASQVFDIGVCLVGEQDQLRLVELDTFSPLYGVPTVLEIQAIDVDYLDTIPFSYELLLESVDDEFVQLFEFGSNACSSTLIDDNSITFDTLEPFKVCYKYLEPGVSSSSSVVLGEVFRDTSLNITVMRNSLTDDINVATSFLHITVMPRPSPCVGADGELQDDCVPSGGLGVVLFIVIGVVGSLASCACLAVSCLVLRHYDCVYNFPCIGMCSADQDSKQDGMVWHDDYDYNWTPSSRRKIISRKTTQHVVSLQHSDDKKKRASWASSGSVVEFPMDYDQL